MSLSHLKQRMKELENVASRYDDILLKEATLLKEAILSKLRVVTKVIPPIATGDVATCAYCNQPIAEDEDFQTGAKRWYSDGGDYGCSSNPYVDEGEDEEDGCGPHEPMVRR